MRVLIATVTAGAGHLQAAAALEETWRTLRPDDQVARLDVLDFTSRLYRKTYVDGYVKLVKHAPDLWSLMFKKADNPALLRKINRVRRALARIPTGRFVREVRRLDPELVLCTHFLPQEILGRLSESRRGPWPFVVSVVTDFEAHALWMEPAVKLYCVAAEETKARLVARGIPTENVSITGIPIAAKFSAPVDVGAVRKRMGLRVELPTLLILGGGFGMGPVKELLGELNRFDRSVQIMVVCGRNEQLREEVAALDHRHPTHVLGFAGNMHELMAVADLILTKPGGLTTSEALAMGKPLLLLDPIPGQEAANSDFLLEHGAAVKINRVEDLPFRLDRLLGSAKLKAMAKAARSLGRPKAAPEICKSALKEFAARADQPTSSRKAE